MKKKVLTLCMVLSMSASMMACGSTTTKTEEPQAEESTASVAESTEAAADTAESAEETTTDTTESTETTPESAEETTTDATEEESKYAAFTDASNAEVEAYAQKVVDAVLAKDWDTVGDMISYPIGSEADNNLCNNKEEFVAYANNTGFDEEYFTSLSAWNVSDLWGNWQGACINDGSIWFSGVDNEGFKIISLFNMAMGDTSVTD